MDEYSPNTISGDYYDDEAPTVSSKNLYLMGEFIQQSVKNNPEIFDIVAKISMAYLIATALAFDEPVDGRLNELADVTLYLDTPIVLRLLGLQTEELEQSYKEMFDTFKSLLNAEFKVFQHTFDEVSGIIGDCSNWIDNTSYNPQYANPALLNFVKKKYTKTEVDLYQLKLESKLNDIGIMVDERDYYDLVNKGEQINSKNLESKLIEVYKKNNPNYNEARNATAIQHDVHSIENIVKLWGRKSAKSYNSLGYIFITSNSTLAYVCRKYTSDYWWDNKNHKSPCITDYYLGTMVWLSTPADKIANVSKLKLLADCSAATTLSREVMEQYVCALERLKKKKEIKNQDFLLLRRYAYEKNYLQNLTLNEEVAFKDDIIEELLEQIKLDLQKPLLDELKEKNSEIENLTLDKEEKERIIEELQKEKDSEFNKKEEELIIDKEKADKCSQLIINTVIPVVTAVTAFITGILQFVPMFDAWNPKIKIASLIVALVSAILLGLLKSNVFNLKDKLVSRVLRYYKISRYKKSL